MFSWLKRLFEIPHGDPIRLDFKCGHYVRNPSPPVMKEEDRIWAQKQAGWTPCPNCYHIMWLRYVRENVYPELRASLTVTNSKVQLEIKDEDQL